MLVKYSPEGQAEPSTWDFQPEKVRQSQAELIEKRSGMTYSKWAKALGDGSSLARKVLLWHLMTRDGHVLRIEDVPDFCFGDLTIDPSLEEFQQIRSQIEASESGTDAERASALAAVDAEIAKLLGKESVDEVDLGKAASPDGD